MPKFFISDVISNISNFNYAPSNRFSIEFQSGPFDGESGGLLFSSDRNLRLFFTCEELTLPGQALSTAEVRNAVGPVKQMPYVKTYTNSFDATFRVGEDMFERLLFEVWHNHIVNSQSNKFKFYDDYTCDAIIRMYDHADNEVFNLKIRGVYPQTIGDISLSQASSTEPLKQQVTFAFHETVAFGDPTNTVGAIENNIFSALFNPRTFTRIFKDGELTFGALEPLKSLSAIFDGNSPIVFEPGGTPRIDVVQSLGSILDQQRRGRFGDIDIFNLGGGGIAEL
tara:strand:+ start:1489 stop:2334 length:846 start_codon:yes stop_codon:yes gene_type:complete